eukprot:Blabericola_migrator_1__5212@NODE_2685_length_2460_cov_117_247388_g103_i3_p2_GENE_NODE_2685_length_2460_cov_117_247388_g103_i3NODE_2685_length_2460_cov_117_247388_g103_i3_p2_ORF_typecomplete_len141_score23_88_NODE_2685_length_2460_cov_117_247388_g103_i3203625
MLFSYMSNEALGNWTHRPNTLTIARNANTVCRYDVYVDPLSCDKTVNSTVRSQVLATGNTVTLSWEEIMSPAELGSYIILDPLTPSSSDCSEPFDALKAVDMAYKVFFPGLKVPAASATDGTLERLRGLGFALLLKFLFS